MKRCLSGLLIVLIILLTSCGNAGVDVEGNINSAGGQSTEAAEEVDVEGNINSSIGQSTEAAEEVALPVLQTELEGNINSAVGQSTEAAEVVALPELYTEEVYIWGDDSGDRSAFEREIAFVRYVEHGNPGYENDKAAFIKNYLLEQDMYKEYPDSVTCNQSRMPLVECYIDEEGGRFSFIIYFRHSGNYDYVDFIICCMTLQLDEANSAGSILYSCAEETLATQETVTDATGAITANISYEYIPSVPLPFITEHSGIRERLWYLHGAVYAALYRNQMLWLYKDRAQFDESGRLVGYSGSDSPSELLDYLKNPCVLFYDSNGRLEAIREELDEEGRLLREATANKHAEVRIEYPPDYFWGYDQEFEFSYYENGVISHVKYKCPWPGTDLSDIYYDEMGRMLYSEHYITHGHHYTFFLYDGIAERPWAYINWCSSNMCWFDEIYMFR